MFSAEKDLKEVKRQRVEKVFNCNTICVLPKKKNLITYRRKRV